MQMHGMQMGAPSMPIANPLGGGDGTAIPPNNSIYINNLNSKIKRDELKKSLYAVFVQFGQILDIITGKCLKMRGQAFVVFAELSSATNALRAMQGFPLYERPMRIQFAKTNSDVIAKQNGTYVERPRTNRAGQAAAAAAEAAANAILEATAGQGGHSARAIRRRQQRAALAAASAAEALAASGHVAIPPPHSQTAASGTYGGANLVAPPPPPGGGAITNNHPFAGYGMSSGMLGSSGPPINPAAMPDQPPNKILFVTNLPGDADEAMLGMLFTQFGGFREVRMVPGRSDIAFVEFTSDAEAAAAKHGLQGFTVRPGHPIRITFAKK